MAKTGVPFKEWLRRWKKAGAPRYPDNRHLKLVLWTDAAGHEDDEETATVLKGIASGFIISADSREIKLAMEFFEDDSAREYLAIPAKMVELVFDVCKVPRLK